MNQTCVIREEDISVEYISAPNLEVSSPIYPVNPQSTEIDGNDRSSRSFAHYLAQSGSIDDGNDGDLDSTGTDGEMEEIEAIGAVRVFA